MVSPADGDLKVAVLVAPSWPNCRPVVPVETCRTLVDFRLTGGAANEMLPVFVYE